jgi:hypothetical protein
MSIQPSNRPPIARMEGGRKLPGRSCAGPDRYGGAVPSGLERQEPVMSSVPGRVFWQVHRVLRAVRAMCNWLRLMDLDVADRSPLSVLGSGVVPEAEKVLRGEQATGPGEVPR